MMIFVAQATRPDFDAVTAVATTPDGAIKALRETIREEAEAYIGVGARVDDEALDNFIIANVYVIDDPIELPLHDDQGNET